MSEKDNKLRSGFGRIAALGLLILLIHSPLSAQNARQLAQATFPSVVLLTMQDANGQPVSLGSGFFVSDEIVATNLHVVRGVSRGQAKLIGQAKTYAVSGLVAEDPEVDLVLLKVPGAMAPGLRLGDSNDLAVGDEVYAVGNPEGLEGTFSQGIVSGIRGTVSARLLQITAPISPGSSGGPVIDSRGEVIGVAVATWNAGQNLNFAIPSSYLAALLKRIGELRPLGAEKETTKNTRPFADILGGKSTDGVVGVGFTWGNQGQANGSFSFTIRNQLQSTVEDVRYLVVFFGSDGKPLDYFDGLTCPDVTILPNLAKRQVAASVVSPNDGRTYCLSQLIVPEEVKNMTRRVEIRVLDFKLAE